jgi:SAM-dependent methyltransferase
MNLYGRELDAAEIAAGAHRDFVGGLWDELGRLQLDFLRAQGLAESHAFVDVGCGALRGGVHFVRYLQPGRYHGLDINASLLEAGRLELEAAGLAGRGAVLMQDDAFRLERFGQRFDRGLALSVFTHLPLNSILRCLRGVAAAMAPGGIFYASYFEAPTAAHLPPITHAPGGVTTHYDLDPFHQGIEEFAWMAGVAGLRLEVIGDWGHPRAQRMLAFHQPGA